MDRHGAAGAATLFVAEEEAEEEQQPQEEEQQDEGGEAKASDELGSRGPANKHFTDAEREENATKIEAGRPRRHGPRRGL